MHYVFLVVDSSSDLQVSECKITRSRDLSIEWMKQWAEDSGIDLEDESSSDLIEMAEDDEGEYVSKIISETGAGFIFTRDEEDFE